MQRFKTLLQFGLVTILSMSVGLAFAQDSDSGEDQDDKNEPTLTIGSKAPELDIEHWLSDNDGLFPEVKKFEADNIYIIDFWSPESPSSIVMMQKMGNIQNDYDGKDVQIISVCTEDLDTVEDFLEKKLFGGDEDNPKLTFGDLTRSYCLTADPDKSVWQDYYVASGRKQFPGTFIVGKTGLIEWIGSSARMTQPLDKIIADKWDREEFKKKYIADQAARAKEGKNAALLRRKLARAMRGIQEKIADGDDDAAIESLAELIEDEDLKSAKPMLLGLRLELMIKNEHAEAIPTFRKFVEENKADGSAINSVAWSIYELYEETGGDVDSEILAIARKGAEYAAKAEPESGAILDTLAHYIYIVDKDLDKAIEVQKKAVKFAGPQLADLKPFLDELLKEKKTGKKKKEKVESDF